MILQGQKVEKSRNAKFAGSPRMRRYKTTRISKSACGGNQQKLLQLLF